MINKEALDEILNNTKIIANEVSKLIAENNSLRQINKDLEKQILELKQHINYGPSR